MLKKLKHLTMLLARQLRPALRVHGNGWVEMYEPFHYRRVQIARGGVLVLWAGAKHCSFHMETTQDTALILGAYSALGDRSPDVLALIRERTGQQAR